MKKSERGFTLVELMTVIVMFGAAILMIWGAILLCVADFWFTSKGVVSHLRVDHPEAVELLRAERHVFDPSVLTIENKDGSRSVYELDSNILFNYRVSPRKQ